MSKGLTAIFLQQSVGRCTLQQRTRSNVVNSSVRIDSFFEALTLLFVSMHQLCRTVSGKELVILTAEMKRRCGAFRSNRLFRAVQGVASYCKAAASEVEGLGGVEAQTVLVL